MKTAAVYFPLLRLWKWPGMYAVVAVQCGWVSVGGWSWSPVGGCDCCVQHGCVLVGGGPQPFRITCGSGRLSSCSVSDWISSSSNPFASSSSLIYCWGGTSSALCVVWQQVKFESRSWTQTQAMSSGLGLELKTCNLRVSLVLANEFGSQTYTWLITWTQSQTLKSNSKFPVKYSTIQTKYNVIQVRLGEYYIYIL